MRRVFICSPWRSSHREQLEKNRKLAQELCLAAIRGGCAPFAPHLLYTQFLDDTEIGDRDIGIAAGLAYLRICDELWRPAGVDPTDGMRSEIAIATSIGLKIVAVML